jgi:hypothetical protein
LFDTHDVLAPHPFMSLVCHYNMGDRHNAMAKVQILCETRKYLWNYLLFSEFSRHSTKKNALFFVFAARKFANIGKNAYLCKLKGNRFLPLK